MQWRRIFGLNWRLQRTANLYRDGYRRRIHQPLEVVKKCRIGGEGG